MTSRPELAFASAAQLLVLLHAVAALALCGAATHHVVVALGYLRGVFRTGLARVYGAVTLGCYLAVFALGSLAYPSYRYFVRGLFLDWHRVWAANLFDIKENVAALGLPLVAGVFVLSRRFDPAKDGSLIGPYVTLVVSVAAIAWFTALSGLFVTMQRGVP
ncbi:MAG: hypothetical protein ACYCWW_09440 [Deltaproteobacteria bacterium]